MDTVDNPIEGKWYFDNPSLYGSILYKIVCVLEQGQYILVGYESLFYTGSEFDRLEIGQKIIKYEEVLGFTIYDGRDSVLFALKKYLDDMVRYEAEKDKRQKEHEERVKKEKQERKANRWWWPF